MKKDLTMAEFNTAMAEKEWERGDTIRVKTDKTIYVLARYDECVLWAKNGKESLVALENAFENGKLVEKAIKIIKERIFEYESDYIHCSDCDTLLQKDEVAGSFFAGRYCKDCWDREWAEKWKEESKYLD